MNENSPANSEEVVSSSNQRHDAPGLAGIGS